MQTNIFFKQTCNTSISVHAEQHVIDKLKPIDKRNKKLKPINILVVRITKAGLLKMSSPCCNCVKYMTTEAPKKGYVVKNIYYSNEEGDIEKISLSNLQKPENSYTSSFYRHRYHKK